MEPTQEKKENVGLSKKEKRALKVKEKQQSPPQQQQIKNDTNKEQQLTEKQKRKLEWEKKLAEQKLQQPQQQQPQNDAKRQESSKAELRQKRREQQEAQRLAKTNAKNEQPQNQPQQQKRDPEAKQSINNKNTVILKESQIKKATNQKIATIKTKTTTTNKIQLVNHLYLENLQRIDEYKDSLINYKNVHPIFIRLGNQYLTKTILGSNARCLALLQAIKILIKDIKIPPKQEFIHYFDLTLQSCVKYLQYCRPFAVTMTNALRYFKGKLRESIKLFCNNTSSNNNDLRAFLTNSVDIYINDEIDKASEAISLKVQEKISNGDIILTYGCSSLIRRILLEAHRANKQFHVIVVDGRPLLEGRQLLQRLIKDGIECSYIQINAINYVMNKVTKVLLGCHALLTNGYVMSRIGTAQVALIAQAYNKPVLVTCETYKFSERVQTDSFVYNEIGDNSLLNSIENGQSLLTTTTMKKDGKLNILNLLYDVTPPNLVTAVVTELAILPCTSVPVVLRIKPTDFV